MRQLAKLIANVWNSILKLVVVTEASEGIGRGYAMEVGSNIELEITVLQAKYSFCLSFVPFLTCL